MGLVSPAAHFFYISLPFFLLALIVVRCFLVKGGFVCFAALSLFKVLSTSSWLTNSFILAGIPNLLVSSNTCLVLDSSSFCSPFARLFLATFGLRPPLAAGLAPKLYYSSCTYFSDSFLVFFCLFCKSRLVFVDELGIDR